MNEGKFCFVKGSNVVWKRCSDHERKLELKKRKIAELEEHLNDL